MPETATAFMSGLILRARPLQKRIVFPEGGDPRVLSAAERLAREGILKPILLGQSPTVPLHGATFIDRRLPKIRADMQHCCMSAGKPAV